MPNWLAITQQDWLRRTRDARHEAVHFWLPSPWQRRDLIAGDRWYFREQTWDKGLGRPPQILGHGIVVRYEQTTPRALFASHGSATGYDSVSELAEGIGTTGYGEQGALDRSIGNIILRDVVVYERPIIAPRDIPTASLVSPNGRTYWPFNDELVRPLLSDSEGRIKASEADDSAFDPKNAKDAREKVLRAIKTRRGQKGFRDALLKAYSGRCAITGCSVLDVLEASHITPYLGPETNHVTNGILLRADLHTLYDCGLFAIDPGTLKVIIAPLLETSSYRKINNRPLRLPASPSESPSKKALRQRIEEFTAHSGSPPKGASD
ncbi:HNH endonuclease [Belnapia sp. T18]|uniref:HNH endonuclease n=1 Tax=Belnapia arida TaxID=2804533 RepID=A0ABS1UC65_9PROT|nr:HNH endonuclease signature motif containing protein [Belnapia arida]MBL6082279.1 HNH endonuclease [Belnapia arida]